MDFIKSPIAKLLLYFVPKNTLFIHLDSDDEALMNRRGRDVESYNFMKIQRTGYKLLEKSVKSLYIDTSNVEVKQAFNQIIDFLNFNQISTR